MSADTRPRLIDTLGRMRRSFRGWRGQRPFWAGLLTLLAGVPIMYVPYQNLTLGSLTVRLATTAGAGSLIIGILLIVLGLTMWFQPASRVFAGVAAILLALVSLVVSNFGAFLIGFLLGLIGGALGVSWAPGIKPARKSPSEPTAAMGAEMSADDGEQHTGTQPAEGGENTGKGGSLGGDLPGASPMNGRYRAA
ncbi:DUF6114 domain-containing protein [Streptomyces sp. NPDC057654]|uniref:DUF6114 domain-containing protein n=1 Tax=Streptomyces sp. NPDC057654 TaxID=3346196 RepID=UPI0036CC15B1